MSVRTTADERLDEAKKRIDEAYDALHDIVVEKCSGHDDFRDDFKRTLKEVFVSLQQIKFSLDD